MAINRHSQWTLFPRNMFILAIIIATGCGTAPTPMTERDRFYDEQERLLKDGTNAYMEGRYDDAYELLSKELEGFRNGASYYMLAIVESARGNDDEAWDLIESAALLGSDDASSLLLDGALKEIEFGTAISNDSQCDIFLDTVRVLSGHIALKFRASHRDYDRRIPFEVHSIYDPYGGSAAVIGVVRNDRQFIDPYEAISFATLVEAETARVDISFSCDRQPLVVSVSLRDPRITAALRSIKQDDSDARLTEVRMTKVGGVYEVPVTLNDVLKIHFIIDSGASDVVISSDVASTLLRTGTVDLEEILPNQSYRIADGSIVEARRFMLRSIQIGDRTFENIPCSVVDSLSAPMLLGQSVLERLGSYSIDYETATLLIH